MSDRAFCAEALYNCITLVDYNMSMVHAKNILKFALQVESVTEFAADNRSKINGVFDVEGVARFSSSLVAAYTLAEQGSAQLLRIVCVATLNSWWKDSD